MLAELHAASFNWPWDRSVMQQYIADRSILTLAALSARSSKLCGFSMTRFVLDEAEILTVSVVPSMRRKGVGKALFVETLETLARQEIETLHLEVSEANISALKLYTRLGFTETGRRPGYYPQKNGTRRLDAILMQKRVLV